MEIIIIGASVIAFLIYIFFYRYYGIDEKIQMFVLHLLVFAYIAVLIVLLIISVTGDYGSFAITSAISALTAFGVIILKYLLAELVGKKR